MFWVVTPCTSEKTDISKGHITSIFKGRRAVKARNQQKKTAKFVSSTFLELHGVTVLKNLNPSPSPLREPQHQHDRWGETGTAFSFSMKAPVWKSL
jgi:hypothetical protein